MGDDREIINSEIIKLLLEIKSDVKEIKNELAKHSDNISQLNIKIIRLENENKELNKKLQSTQKETRKNNLVIFGIKEEEDIDTNSQVKTLINNEIGVELCDNDIDNTYRIGAKQNSRCRPIILKVIRNTIKQEILSKCRNLKGTGVSIAHDLTPDERKIQKVIYKHYKTAKEDKKNVKIVGQRLIINGKVLRYEDLVRENDHTTEKEGENINIENLQESTQKDIKKDKEKKRNKDTKQFVVEKYTSTRAGKAGATSRET